MDSKPAIEIQVTHDDNEQSASPKKLGPQVGKVNVLVSTYKHRTQGDVIRMSFDKPISQLDMTIASAEHLIRKLTDAHNKIKRVRSAKKRLAELARRKKRRRKATRDQRKRKK